MSQTEVKVLQSKHSLCKTQFVSYFGKMYILQYYLCKVCYSYYGHILLHRLVLPIFFGNTRKTYSASIKYKNLTSGSEPLL